MPETDPQSAAFRGAGPGDWAGDEDVRRMIEGGELTPVPDDSPIMSPEDWDEIGWDHGREEPKTLDEARAALADRVADPAAPDTDASAYDDLES